MDPQAEETGTEETGEEEIGFHVRRPNLWSARLPSEADIPICGTRTSQVLACISVYGVYCLDITTTPRLALQVSQDSPVIRRQKKSQRRGTPLTQDFPQACGRRHQAWADGVIYSSRSHGLDGHGSSSKKMEGRRSVNLTLSTTPLPFPSLGPGHVQYIHLLSNATGRGKSYQVTRPVGIPGSRRTNNQLRKAGWRYNGTAHRNNGAQGTEYGKVSIKSINNLTYYAR